MQLVPVDWGSDVFARDEIDLPVGLPSPANMESSFRREQLDVGVAPNESGLILIKPTGAPSTGADRAPVG